MGGATANDRPELESLARAFGTGGVPVLRADFERRAPSVRWIEVLIDAVPDPELAVAATWLLRAYLEVDLELSAAQTAALLRIVERVRADDARLHLCQCVARLTVPRRNGEQLARFLRACSQDEHKFLRAWAMDAFFHLGLQDARYAHEAAKLLRLASKDPAASVRARARKIEARRGIAPRKP